MKKTRAARIIAGLLALGLVAAACGDDGGDSETTSTTAKPAATGTTGSTGTASGCKDGAAPIKIGGLAQAQNFAGMEDGIKAVVEKANKTCIGGRKLEFVGLKDDGSDPQKNLDLAKQLVESDKVFAIIATSAVLLPATTDYLNSKKVPFFGWGFMPGFCGKDSWGYGFNGCLSGFALKTSTKTNGSLSEPVAKFLKKDADKMTLVIFNSDDDAGKFGDLQYSALFSKSQVLAKVNVPVQGAGDYTQFVNKVKETNPDAVMVSTDFVSGIKMKAALAAAGYKGVVYDYVTYIPGLLESSKDTAAALEGGYSVTQFPANEDNTAAIKQITEDLKASGSKVPFATQGASIGYWSTDLFRQMLVATAAKGDITPDNFRKVVEGGFESTPVEGGLGKVKFPDGHLDPVPCAGVVQVKGGKYVSAVPFACYNLLAAKS
jgi:branched-chain amino acid transport system substrate-binding protein